MSYRLKPYDQTERTKKRNATPPFTNQNKTMRADIPRMSAHVLHIRQLVSYGKLSNMRQAYSQFRLAHHSVKRKNTARTRDATLLALMSNPHAMRQAPMKLEPR